MVSCVVRESGSARIMVEGRGGTKRGVYSTIGNSGYWSSAQAVKARRGEGGPERGLCLTFMVFLVQSC